MKNVKNKIRDVIQLREAEINCDGKIFLIEKDLDAINLLSEEKKKFWVRKTHFIQLELLANLCSLIENYFYYRNIISSSTKGIFLRMLRNQTGVAWDESNRTKRIIDSAIKKEFGFPKKKPIQLTSIEWKTLKEIIKREIYFHKHNQELMAKFWQENQPVYNIFKHGMTFILGMENRIEDDLNHLYLRGYTSSKDKKVRTFILGSSPKIYREYDNLRKIVHCEYHFLIQTTILLMYNESNIVVPKLYMPIKDEEDQIKGILNKLPYTNPKINFVRELNITGKALKKIVNSKRSVIIINSDLFYNRFKGQVIKASAPSDSEHATSL